MSQLATNSVITLVLGLVIGLPQLLLAVLTWCAARKSASRGSSQSAFTRCFNLLTSFQSRTPRRTLWTVFSCYSVRNQLQHSWILFLLRIAVEPLLYASFSPITKGQVRPIRLSNSFKMAKIYLALRNPFYRIMWLRLDKRITLRYGFIIRRVLIELTMIAVVLALRCIIEFSVSLLLSWGAYLFSFSL